MRIPITMCHGVNPGLRRPLTADRFENYFRMTSELGFASITYEDLARWRGGIAELPERPIMFDFDHPYGSIYHEIYPMMKRLGFVGNLFLNTEPLVNRYSDCMTWDDVREMMSSGWHIGSHTHSHPNLSELALEDPSGARIREELATCDRLLRAHVGITPKDFAFTGATWSRVAEEEVKKRYRFGRLWIISALYEADGRQIRYADLAGVPGPDEEDGGPPFAARYITRDTDPYRLPSMELEGFIHEYEAFRRYLEGALATMER